MAVMSDQDYLRQMLALLPPGRAMQAEPGSAMADLLSALSVEFSRIDGRASDLIRQADPRTVDELLTEWEKVAGLPSVCAPEPETIQERRAALLGRVTGTGGQSRGYYINLAKALGYQIGVKEFFPFRAGSRAGDPLTNASGWRHTWRVDAGSSTVRHFKAGSRAGEPLRRWGNDLLECAIDTQKPAHTLVQFAYYLEDQHA